MSNQRPGKYHSASGVDLTIQINVFNLISFCRDAQSILTLQGEEDSALRFEILGDYLTQDYKGGEINAKRALGV